ncbi:MAG: VCBS repeat-containing protein [Pseudomonadota bacterium]
MIRIVKVGFLTLPLLLAGTALAQPVAQVIAIPGTTFTPVQTELFNKPNTYSNAWADFDKDGWLDLAVSSQSGEIRLFRNVHGKFVSVGAEMGLPTIGKESRGLSWGDYDGDGWPDLYSGSADPKGVSSLFHNLDGKKFVNVAPEMGVEFPGRSSRQSNFIDYDNDGKVDLYATDRIGKNKLFHNEGGKFVQVMTDGAVTVFSSTVGACWFDYNKDGLLDLFLGNQSGKADALLRNNGDGTFTDVAPALHMDLPSRTAEEGGVGCAIGDYDADGNLDIFVPNYGRNVLWHSNGDGTFTNTAEEMGVAVENHAVGASWGDYDNDGFPDLFISSYTGPRGEQQPHDALFHNQGGKGFVNVITTDSALNRSDHGAEWVDYDNDGALDLSITRGYTAAGGQFLFHNNLPKAAAAHSLAVMVLDAKGHYTQAGAEVRVYDQHGKILGAAEVSSGGGYGVQDIIPVHFGLPNQTKVTVEVTFMSNTGRKVHRVPNVTLSSYYGKSLVVRRPAGI